jgi:hypothetical protein
MKNLHLIPTDKPSRLHITGKLMLYPNGLMPKSQGLCKNQHIYITSDEFIEEGDFGLNLSTKNIVQYDGIKGLDSYYKKIILTTDQNLIADGVQAIDDEFLEWFVKNPSCEKVEVVSELKIFDKNDFCVSCAIYDTDYTKMIYYIVPKEEPKQETLTYTEAAKKEERIFNSTMRSKQETLEEAAENYADKQSDISMRQNPLEYSKSGEELWYESKVDFIEGAKWQQEQDNKELAMWKLAVEKQEARCTALRGVISDLQDKNKYSEEEVRKIAEEVRWQVPATGNPREFTKNFDKWFEQFKKK